MSFPKSLLALLLLNLAACRDASHPPADDGDAALPLPADAAPADVALAPDALDLPDGPPVRRACTSHFGAALDTLHGRLDGVLVSIVHPGVQSCNGDSGHVHLQVEMDGATYDVAINVDDQPSPVLYVGRDLALPDGPWSEGWHTAGAGALDYPALGVHARDFAAMNQDALVAALDAELAAANHVSIFMTGYGADGGHEVHRRGTFLDGAIVVRPLSAAPRLLFFRFADQSF